MSVNILGTGDTIWTATLHSLQRGPALLCGSLREENWSTRVNGDERPLSKDLSQPSWRGKCLFPAKSLKNAPSEWRFTSLRSHRPEDVTSYF